MGEEHNGCNWLNTLPSFSLMWDRAHYKQGWKTSIHMRDLWCTCIARCCLFISLFCGHIDTSQFTSLSFLLLYLVIFPLPPILVQALSCDSSLPYLLPGGEESKDARKYAYRPRVLQQTWRRESVGKRQAASGCESRGGTVDFLLWL